MDQTRDARPSAETRPSRGTAKTTPHPDDPRKPDSPVEVKKAGWKFTAKSALREFTADGCTDLAAALTYYMVMALFPALLALVSLLGIFGQGQGTTHAMVDLVRDLAPGQAADQLRGIIDQVVSGKGSGIALFLGLATALWSASGYVGAFGRALNTVYETDEGRPVWKLRPQQLLLTLALVAMAALVLMGLVVSGPIAEAIGDLVGLGSTSVMVWGIAKWPVILFVVTLMVALLYHFTPNVQQPKFKWLSVGAAVAILAWVLLSLLMGLYVTNFGNYNKTYGTLAGVFVMLLWLWLTNVALLFGAQIDAELERARQLQAGLRAEETLQLPPRDTRQSEKAAAKEAEAIAEAREIRLDARHQAKQEVLASPTGDHASFREQHQLDDDGFVIEADPPSED